MLVYHSQTQTHTHTEIHTQRHTQRHSTHTDTHPNTHTHIQSDRHKHTDRDTNRDTNIQREIYTQTQTQTGWSLVLSHWKPLMILIIFNHSDNILRTLCYHSITTASLITWTALNNFHIDHTNASKPWIAIFEHTISHSIFNRDGLSPLTDEQISLDIKSWSLILSPKSSGCTDKEPSRNQ